MTSHSKFYPKLNFDTPLPPFLSLWTFSINNVETKFKRLKDVNFDTSFKILLKIEFWPFLPPCHLPFGSEDENSFENKFSASKKHLPCFRFFVTNETLPPPCWWPKNRLKKIVNCEEFVENWLKKIEKLCQLHELTNTSLKFLKR